MTRQARASDRARLARCRRHGSFPIKQGQGPWDPLGLTCLEVGIAALVASAGTRTSCGDWRSLSAHQRGLDLLQPESRVHVVADRGRCGEMLAGLLALTRTTAVDLAEADAALGGERAHAKVASECQGLARLRDRDRQATPSNMCRQLIAAARDYP